MCAGVAKGCYIRPMDGNARIRRQASAGAIGLCLAIGAAVLAFAPATSHAGITRVGGTVGASTIVAYSARPGGEALDGLGASRNSPYTGALLRFLEVPIDVGLMLRLVRDEVLESTSGEQEPTIVHGSVSGRGVYLAADSPSRRSGRRGNGSNEADPGSGPSTRTALTIGNRAYANLPLENPLRDAADVADALERLGFSVIRIENAGRDALERSLEEFGEHASGAEIAVVYFAGYMFAGQGRDYLVPVDADLWSDLDADAAFVPMSRVMSAVEPASVLRFVIIDGPSGRWPPSSSTPTR